MSGKTYFDLLEEYVPLSFKQDKTTILLFTYIVVKQIITFEFWTANPVTVVHHGFIVGSVFWVPYPKIGDMLPLPTEQCSNCAPKIYFSYVSWLRICQLFTVLTGVVFESLKLTVPGMETISTRAKMIEHSILDHLAISDLQIISASGRSGRKFKPMI